MIIAKNSHSTIETILIQTSYSMMWSPSCVCSNPQSIENAFVTGTQVMEGTGRVRIEVSEKVRPQVVCQFPLDR